MNTNYNGLTEKILARISRRERRILGIKIAAFAAVFVSSVSFTVFGFMSLGAELARSGSLQFLSLFLSDFSSATTNFPDIAFSVAESFPVFSAALLLGGVAFAVWSVAGLLDETSRMRAGQFSFK